jgi:hypothetical protein
MTLSRKTCIGMALLIACAVCGLRDPIASAQSSGASADLYAGAASRSGAVSVGRGGRDGAVAVTDPYGTDPYGANWLRIQAAESRLTEPVLVVPGKEVDAETVGRIVEDLSVMSRILEKNALSAVVSPNRRAAPLLGHLRWGPETAGPEVLFPSAGRPKPLYVAGYGAVFFVQVDFPLLPPPEAKDQTPATEQADAVWAETRRALFEPRTSPVLPRGGAEAPAPYSQERVGTLKSTLIAAMRHATNIRALEPGERLTIVVQGPSPRSADSTTAAVEAGSSAKVQDGRSVLTLRASKADIDLHAKGELSAAQFEQRVQVVSY